MTCSRADFAELERRLQEQIAKNKQLEQLLHLNTSAHATDAARRSHGTATDSSSMLRSKTTVGPSVMTQDSMRHRGPSSRRAISQQGEPMSRSTSARSDSGMPFRQLGPVAALAPSHANSRLGPSRDDFVTPPFQRAMPSNLPIVRENYAGPKVGMHPGDYVATSWGQEGYIVTGGTDLPSTSFQQQHVQVAPSMSSGWSAPEEPSPLTRQNSTFDGQALHDAQMARLESSQTQRTDDYFSPDAMCRPDINIEMFPGDVSHGPDLDLIGCGSSLASAPQLEPPNFSSNNMFLQSFESETMERTASSSSTSSAKSTTSNVAQRAKLARERAIKSSQSNVILPKPVDPTPAAAAGKPPATSSSASGKRNGKVPVDKPKYKRPEHAKVFCKMCDQQPLGFRGEHELRRHKQAKHGGKVRRFVCRDPASVGLHSTILVKNPLAGCKSCMERKQYGAYYNAAAHLRRTHFKPKAPRGKGKSGTEERRGGKGGGDWPKMEELKLWFEEVLVDVNQPGALLDDDADELDAFGDVEMESPLMGIHDGQDPMSQWSDYPPLLDDAEDMSDLAVSTSMPMATSTLSPTYTQYLYTPNSDGQHSSGISVDYSHSPYGSTMSSQTMITSMPLQETFSSMDQLSQQDDVWGTR